MDTDIQHDLSLYTQFMNEIRERTGAIQRMLDRLQPGKLKIEAGYVEVESCILQVRYCCELIALAVLAAHRQLGISAKLLKSWNADETFSRLAHINPNCFPRAASITRPKSGLHIELRRDQMAMEELQTMYADCGELLHRGVLKHALAGTGRSYRVEDVIRHASRIRALLSQHVVMLLEPGCVFIVQMMDPNGMVDVLYAKSPGPAVFVEQP